AHRTSPGKASGTVVRTRGRAAKRSGRHQLRRRQKAAEAIAEA
ncbi:MAG: hypothetical protein JWO63_754, partial [Frankiales bacterium]|nr:hypothetical protein [Frankiales bacterium]